MQQRALSKPKIELIWNSVVVAYGDENGKGLLGGLKVKNVVVSGDVSDLKIYGLFFAIGHEPATKFLDGQFELDEDGAKTNIFMLVLPRITIEKKKKDYATITFTYGSLREVTAEDNVNEKRNTNNIDAMLVP
ncbi:hypothetical protein F2Q69_00048884 [Brassica cretica]|uniref:FAD/NAD(P)-binding domain-containing protein n=1 Tax=Brassica cretica TaxID=69181 RepID=A0A8S9PU78_BRACR|nr:hypothetical protein F2Q69_00048884 [Brassica cretica]